MRFERWIGGAVLAAVLTGGAAQASDAVDPRKAPPAPGARPGVNYWAPALSDAADPAAPLAPHLRPGAKIEAKPGERPAFWRVRDADTVVWLFGSIHALPAAAQWRRPDLMRALRAADVVYFETPMNRLDARKHGYAKSRNVYLPSGEDLFDHISEESGEAFKRALRRLPKQWRRTVARMKPWAAVGALRGEHDPDLHMEGSRGVDPQLGVVASQLGKELRYFKTPQQQHDVFAKMPFEDQLAYFEVTLQRIDQGVTTYTPLVTAWLSGDQNRLLASIQDEDARLPDGVNKRLLDDRNIQWAEEIDAFLKGAGQDALVVGGAAHFVGPNNVIQFLEEKGWRVERL